MTMNRFLAPLPATYDFPQMQALTVSRFISAAGVNEVDNGDGTRSLAVYINGSPAASTLTAWRSDVATAVVQHPTADEQAIALAANADTLRQRATAALAANATFLAAAKPGTAAAQASIGYDQTVRLTKECNALIRLALGLLSDISDTA